MFSAAILVTFLIRILRRAECAVHAEGASTIVPGGQTNRGNAIRSLSRRDLRDRQPTTAQSHFETRCSEAIRRRVPDALRSTTLSVYR